MNIRLACDNYDLRNINNQIKIINSQNELLKRTYSHTISQSEFGNLDYVFSIYINEDSIKLLEKLHQGCLNIGELCEYIIEGIVTPKGKDDFISDKAFCELVETNLLVF